MLCFDVGMNNGDDVAYYLAKGLRVVGIEANSSLCNDVRQRFSLNEPLEILNIGVGPSPGVLKFFVHIGNPVMSTFQDPPAYDVLEAFRPVNVQVKRLSDVVRYHGDPHYIKIDVEGFDAACLLDLLLSGIRPPYISAEAHTIDTFCILVAMGYDKFKMVCGSTVHVEFASSEVQHIDGHTFQHSFPLHSAGPYGEDIPGSWMNKADFLACWLDRRPSWYDIHAKL